MTFLQSIDNPILVGFASFVTEFGQETFLVMILGFIYWCWNKEMGKYAGLNMIASVVFLTMFKNVFLRRRPYFDNEEIKCLRKTTADADMYDISKQGYSFPSGHASNSISLYGSLAWFIKKKWAFIVAGIMILFIGWSRVYLGNHYPTDVLAGWLLGLVIIVICNLLQKWLKSTVKVSLIFVIVAIPGWFFCQSEDFFANFGLLAAVPLVFWLEEKYIKFENVHKVLPIICRFVVGIVLYAGLNTLLKIILPGTLLGNEFLPMMFMLAFRYFVLFVIIFGVYPLVFRFRPFK
ncbi:MAG: phosphatase PAP2 family protein [Enterococcus sp.]|nr:phosphatase PAP2 family protein [Enterococcus sp.]